MERVPFRATCYAIALTIAGAAAASTVAAEGGRRGSVDSEADATTPWVVPEAVLTAIRPYSVKLRSPDGDGDNGFGLIIAQRGSEVVIATAAHVVLTPTGEHTNNLIASFYVGEGRPSVDAVATFLQGQDVIDKGVLDLAFIVVRLPQPLPLAGAPAAPRSPRPGEQVWVVASVADAPWSAEPGRAGQLAGKDEIAFQGGAVQTGSSGAPLVIRGGVTGLVRSTTGATTYAVPLTTVRAEFVRRYADRYQWVLAYTPLLPDVGLIRASRTDQLSRTFPVGVELAGGELVVPLLPDSWQEVPEGRYTLRVAAAMAGAPAELSCQPEVVTVRAFTQRPLSLTCRADPSGSWEGPGGHLSVTRVDASSYSVVELDSAGREVARGTGTVFNDVFTLAMVSPVFESWSAPLTLRPGIASGRRTYADTRMEEDVLWSRVFR